MQSIFGTDGIRGRFNKEITLSLAYKVGYALGAITKKTNPILIGRDTRISGEILLEAVVKGIIESGKEYIYAGICPTPAIPFLIRTEFFSCGIMISASHNPPEYNGIKIFDSKGEKIPKDFENKIESIIKQINDNNILEKTDFPVKINKNLLDKYMNSLIESSGGESLGGMKIILDTCYGSATTCAKSIFQRLGADVETINNKQNGSKINLNCGSTHLEPLKKAIKENSAEIGFSFDGDADRVIGIDSRGNELDGDHILFLWGRELMKEKALTNNLLVSTNMANLGFENAWTQIGGVLLRTDVGDKFIHEAIKRENANLGGEQSGHILSEINNFSGDGILTAIQISKYCKRKNITLDTWLKSSFSPYPQKLTGIELRQDIKIRNAQLKELIKETIENYSGANSKNCRIYIRPSGTEPLLRILIEARNQELVSILSKEITSKLSKKINKFSTFV